MQMHPPNHSINLGECLGAKKFGFVTEVVTEQQCKCLSLKNFLASSWHKKFPGQGSGSFNPLNRARGIEPASWCCREATAGTPIIPFFIPSFIQQFNRMPSIRKSVPGSEDTADKGATHRNISSTRKHWDPELGATHLQAEWVFEVSNARMGKKP